MTIAGAGVGLGFGRRRRTPPVVASMDPAFGSPTGDTLAREFLGVGFTGATAASVKINGISATAVTVHSDVRMTAVWAAGALTLPEGTYVATVNGSNAVAYYSIALHSHSRADQSIQPIAGHNLTVSSVPDASNSGDPNKIASQAVDTNRLLLNTADAILNNRHSLTCNGTLRRLVTGVWAVPAGTPRTLYVVCRKVGGSVEVAIDGLSPAARTLFYSAGTPTMHATADLASGVAWGATGHVICNVFNGATSEIYVDRVTLPDATGNAGTTTCTGLTIGSTHDGSFCWSGGIAEWIPAVGAHNLASRNVIMRSLGRYYGITVGA